MPRGVYPRKPGSASVGRMKPCKACGTLFHCPPCHDEGGTQAPKLFCSDPCYRTYNRRPHVIAARWEASIQKTDGCWIFAKSAKPDGYRFFRYPAADGSGQVQWYAHRYSWTLANGPIPEGMEVAHRCDNRGCVRPDHLFLATHDENMADCKAKRRHAHGERSTSAILTEADVRTIRARYKRTSFKVSNIMELADEFKVARGVIYAVVSRRSWKHIE